MRHQLEPAIVGFIHNVPLRPSGESGSALCPLQAVTLSISSANALSSLLAQSPWILLPVTLVKSDDHSLFLAV